MRVQPQQEASFPSWPGKMRNTLKSTNGPHLPPGFFPPIWGTAAPQRINAEVKIFVGSP